MKRQLISTDRRKSVLRNSGTPNDTLISYIRYLDANQNQRERLQERLQAIVNQAQHQLLRALEVKSAAAATKWGLQISIPLNDADLTCIGLKATRDKNWTLTFGNADIKKTTVSEIELITILDRNDIERLRSVDRYMGVVTAIYSVTGGLTYTGDIRLVTVAGAQLEPSRIAPFDITAGWQLRVTDSETITVSATNTDEWIIAIEILEFVKDRSKNGGNKPLRFVSTP